MERKIRRMGQWRNALTLLVTVVFCISLTSCTTQAQTNDMDANQSASSDATYVTLSSLGASEATAMTNAIDDKVKDEDTDAIWDAAAATKILLNGTSATVSGSGASVSGATVTISKAGTYVVSGTLTGGQVVIDAEKTDLVRLVLNGAHITAGTNAAVYAAVADKLVLILAEGTENSLTDAANYTYADAVKEEPNAALFSKCDLSICGTGSLMVTGNFHHGISTKDDLVIASGMITVTAKNFALRGKDSVTILDGTLALTSSEGDGIKSTNGTDAGKGWVLIRGGHMNVNAYNDGIQAETILQIDGGTICVSAGGGWPGGSLKLGSHARTNAGVVSGSLPVSGSYKGIKAGQDLVINGGVFTISAYEDGVHSNGNIVINGGSLTLQSGKQSIHADSAVMVNAGRIDIQNSFEGIEGSYINLNGGELSIRSTDDGINVNSSSGLLTIAGGSIYIDAGGDGIDSNNSVVMTGGIVYIDGPTASNDGAIDCQNAFTISGGTIVAADNGGMPQALSLSSPQPSILIYYRSAQQAGTELSLRSSDGAVVVGYTPQKAYSSTVISSPALQQGATYSLYSGSTKLCDVTLSTSVTTISDNGSAAMGGGGMGGGGKGGRGR